MGSDNEGKRASHFFSHELCLLPLRTSQQNHFICYLHNGQQQYTVEMTSISSVGFPKACWVMRKPTF
jgi:hypothetical protein